MLICDLLPVEVLVIAYYKNNFKDYWLLKTFINIETGSL